MKPQAIPITKDIAETIVQMCFDTNALERLCQPEETNGEEHPYHHPSNLKRSIDQLISSDSYQSMQRHFGVAKSIMNVMTDSYKNTPNLSEHQTAVLKTLNQLYTDVLKLETLITKIQTSQ